MKLIRFFRTGVFLLTAAGDDRFFGTENNDTFTAEAGTLQAGDSLLDQSTSDNDTLNAVITNANRDIAPTLLNIENVNLDLDVFSGAAFDAANTDGATVTASSSKLGFNGEFTLNNTGDNNIVAGENVTNLIVNGLEAGTVNTGAAEEATVTTDSANDDANVTINGDIDLTVATSETLNLTATADSVVDLAQTANSVDTIVGSGEGAITLRGDAAQLNGDNITGVSSVVIASGATGVDASGIEADLTLATDLGANTLEVATGANVAIAEEQTNLNIDGQDDNSTVNVTSDLTALGTLAFAGASLASAELQLSAANAEVTSLTADDLALTVNIAEGAEITTLDGTAIDFVGAGDVVVTTGTNADVLDASGLDGDLELTSAATGSQEIAGAVGNNTIVFGATANLVGPPVVTNTATFVGQSGNDDVTFGAVDGNVEATFAGGNNEITFTGAFAGEASIVAGDGNDTLAFEGTVANGADVTAQLGGGTNTLVLDAGVDTTNADTFIIEGLTNLQVADNTSVVRADLLSGEEIAVNGAAGTTTLTVTGTDNDGETIDLSGLSLSNTVDENISAVAVTGGNGNDIITGTAVADTIIGGTGNDSITAGAGADLVYGGAGADTIDLSETTAAADVVGYQALTEGSAAGAVGATFSGFDAVTGFGAGDTVRFDTDLLTAQGTNTVADNKLVVSANDATTGTNDLTEAADFVDVDSVVAFLNDAASYTPQMNTNDVVGVTFEGSTYLYGIANDGTAAVAATEVTLIGTVDAELTADSITIA